MMIVCDLASILNALLMSCHATILHVIISMHRTQYQRLHVSKHHPETMYLPILKDLCLDLRHPLNYILAIVSSLQIVSISM